MTKWRKISTAPKDGTRFIAYYRDPKNSCWMDGPYLCERHSRPSGVEFWHNVNNGVCNPTHWMPLPEPPSEAT